jgi:hypothetical protein
MKQLGMAISMYSQDHDGAPPIGAWEYFNSVQQQEIRVTWEDALVDSSYVRTYNLFRCPSDNVRDYRAAFGVNSSLMGWGNVALLDSIPFPSNTVMVAEKTGLV